MDIFRFYNSFLVYFELNKYEENIIFILIVCSVFCVSLAKDPLGKVSVTMNDGSVINGYCENLFKHERQQIKVSLEPNGKSRKI